MATKPGPAVRRRQLGRQLKELRTQAGLTMDEAAQRSGLSRASISRIESAKQTILPRNVRLLCQVYGIGAPLIDHLVRLAEESEERGWHLANSDTVPNWFERFVKEEQEATEVWNYEAEFIPGLLQTAAYCEAISAVSVPNVTEEELRDAVSFRKARQARLEGKNPLRLIAVINEAAIRRVVGSRDLMREQLWHLVELAARPNIVLQVLPFAAGAHPGMTNSFAMLHFPDDAGVTTVFVEVSGGGIYPDRPADIERYTWIFQRLRQLSLSPRETADLLSSVAAEL